MNWCEKAAAIKAIVLDVDGVLTDGRLGYGTGTVLKFFHVRDGHAIKMAMREGLKVGILSGRDDAANRQRAADLELSFLYEKVHRKGEGFLQLCREQGLEPRECLYIGDDVVDIPVLRLAGIGVAVADAPPEVAAHAAYVTSAAGGQGAVREVIFLLLKAQGLYDRAMARYLS